MLWLFIIFWTFFKPLDPDPKHWLICSCFTWGLTPPTWISKSCLCVQHHYWARAMRKIVGSKKHNVYYATSGGSFENLAKHLVMLVSYKTYLKLYFSYKKNLKKTKTQNCLTLFCIICLSLFLPLSNLALRYSLECSVHFEIF